MKLWIFGDSYAQDHGVDTQWQRLLAEHYQCDIQFDALAGYSNQRILWGVKQQLPQIQSDDVVIVITTDCMRQWFWQDYPQYSNYYNLKQLEMPNSAANWQALQHYTRWLINPVADQFTYECQLAWLNSLSCNTVIIPAFANLPTENALTELVSEQEFLDAQHQKLWRQRGPDTRLNHLSTYNHVVLAHKISQQLDLAQPVDLSRDFHTHFLTV